jgi:5'-3' exonuclease
MLALGCGSTIKYHNGKLIEFNLDMIKHELNITQEQIIDICILFGCDYLRHPFKLNCDDVYNMIKKHGSLLDVLCSNEHEYLNMSNNNVKIIGENYHDVKQIYLNSWHNENIPHKLKNIKMNLLDYDKIIIFLKNIQRFDISNKNLTLIKKDIENINQLILNNVI